MSGNAPRFVDLNGVQLDLMSRFVFHRGVGVGLPDAGIKLIAALARVKPALLDDSAVAKKVFGRIDQTESLRDLVAQVNPMLLGTQLEVRTVGKMGLMLADLGA